MSLARYACQLIAITMLAASANIGTAADSAPALDFRLDEGRNLNSFVRDGAVAAHLLLRSCTEPRILVAFPAGNSGVGLWFGRTEDPVTWRLVGSPRTSIRADRKGRPLRGIEAEAIVDASALQIQRAVLSSVRVLRDYEHLGSAPAEVSAEPTVDDRRISWARDRLDGAAGYQLIVEALGNASLTGNAITTAPGGAIRLRITALTGETPLTPLGGASLFASNAASDARARDVLSFLSYREKYLAGSWRFDTYFGRDTLVSLTLLAPALQPAAIELGLTSVLERLASNGEVAHEEDIGEFAVLRNAKEGRGRSDAPIYDYSMVDDDFMLAPLASRWLLDNATGRARAPAFLASRDGNGVRAGDAIVRNFAWVIGRTAEFAKAPAATRLVGIKPGRNTGQWRDSEEGLGRGRYPYDINVALVPAALEAIDRLVDSGLLDTYISADARRVLTQADRQWHVWSREAAPLFLVTIPAVRARADISSYAAASGLDASRPLASLHGNAVTFNALSLDAQGRPVPVMHSDDSFVLLFGTPTPAQLERAITTAIRPFPAGLLTPVGMLVANPVFAAPEVRARFTNAEYHGTVVWSWQQAMMAAGLDRQLARSDLTPSLRAALISARNLLWSAIESTSELRSSELWSWSVANGCYDAQPFGQRREDVDESNAAQLWSAVFLALSPPAERRANGALARCSSSLIPHIPVGRPPGA